MPYNVQLADRVREYLAATPHIHFQEKKMFGGLAFMINHKMCINVSQDRLMCRFDPTLEQEVSEKTGFEPMIMKGKQLQGYCYVTEEGYKSPGDFKYWLGVCLDFNGKINVNSE